MQLWQPATPGGTNKHRTALAVLVVLTVATLATVTFEAGTVRAAGGIALGISG